MITWPFQCIGQSVVLVTSLWTAGKRSLLTLLSSTMETGLTQACMLSYARYRGHTFSQIQRLVGCTKWKLRSYLMEQQKLSLLLENRMKRTFKVVNLPSFTVDRVKGFGWGFGKIMESGWSAMSCILHRFLVFYYGKTRGVPKLFLSEKNEYMHVTWLQLACNKI